MQLRQLALAVIALYQRHISPHKGFACAHRLHCGGASCSTVGARLIRRYGLRDGLPLVRERLARCGEVARAQRGVVARPMASQRGDCDMPCDPSCDTPDCRGGGSGRKACDLMSCACDSCDLFDGKTRDERRAKRKRGQR